MIICSSCGEHAHKGTERCPKCDEVFPPPLSSMGLLLFFVALLAAGAWSWASVFSGDPDQAPSPRESQIARQFSAFSGIHYNLERIVTEAMNDPDSFDHVETGYVDDGDSLRVQMVYRGKNAFGGIVTNRVTARVSLDGEVLEILEQ